MTSFNDFNLKPALLEAVADINFQTPTPVQERLIPEVLAGRDVVGQSATGSGKTHTFLLPIFNQLDSNKKAVQAVITTPSRELAYQIADAAKQLRGFVDEDILIGTFVGGTDKKRQVERLHREQPQLVIGTPGRIWDLIESEALDIHEANQLVIDEADMTMDMGFMDLIDKIATRFGKKSKH